MISEIAIVLGILLAAIILFVTELVRVDIVALMVLVSLGFTLATYSLNRSQVKPDPR